MELEMEMMEGMENDRRKQKIKPEEKDRNNRPGKKRRKEKWCGGYEDGEVWGEESGIKQTFKDKFDFLHSKAGNGVAKPMKQKTIQLLSWSTLAVNMVFDDILTSALERCGWRQSLLGEEQMLNDALDYNILGVEKTTDIEMVETELQVRGLKRKAFVQLTATDRSLRAAKQALDWSMDFVVESASRAVNRVEGRLAMKELFPRNNQVDVQEWAQKVGGKCIPELKVCPGTKRRRLNAYKKKKEIAPISTSVIAILWSNITRRTNATASLDVEMEDPPELWARGLKRKAFIQLEPSGVTRKERVSSQDEQFVKMECSKRRVRDKQSIQEEELVSQMEVESSQEEQQESQMEVVSSQEEQSEWHMEVVSSQEERFHSQIESSQEKQTVIKMECSKEGVREEQFIQEEESVSHMEVESSQDEQQESKMEVVSSQEEQSEWQMEEVSSQEEPFCSQIEVEPFLEKVQQLDWMEVSPPPTDISFPPTPQDSSVHQPAGGEITPTASRLDRVCPTQDILCIQCGEKPDEWNLCLEMKKTLMTMNDRKDYLKCSKPELFSTVQEKRKKVHSEEIFDFGGLNGNKGNPSPVSSRKVKTRKYSYNIRNNRKSTTIKISRGQKIKSKITSYFHELLNPDGLRIVENETNQKVGQRGFECNK